MTAIVSRAFEKLQASDIEFVFDTVERLGTTKVVIDDEALLYCLLVIGGAVNEVRDIELGLKKPSAKFGHELKRAIEEILYENRSDK